MNIVVDTLNQTMTSYTKKSLERELSVASAPAEDNIFGINPNSTRLTVANTMYFYSIVVKLLYCTVHGKAQILIAIS